MRLLLVGIVLSITGCANTVFRIEGEPRTPEGPATTECEKAGFLVIAPTRAEIADEGSKISHPREGEGIYNVGGKDPQSIVDLRDTTATSPILDRKEQELEPYERRKIIAASLGAAGVIAMTVGTVLFITAFGSEEKVNPDGTREEEQKIDGTKAGIGGALVGVGFGLGISGLVVNPSHAARTRANAARYVFLSPNDDPEEVNRLVSRHNTAVRRRCEATSAEGQ